MKTHRELDSGYAAETIGDVGKGSKEATFTWGSWSIQLNSEYTKQNQRKALDANKINFIIFMKINLKKSKGKKLKLEREIILWNWFKNQRK